MSKNTKSTTVNSLTTKRFVIRKALIGSDTVITFTNSKGVKYTYNHDQVYNTFKEKFEAMPCFEKYKSYTNSNAVPAFARNLDSVVIE